MQRLTQRLWIVMASIAIAFVILGAALVLKYPVLVPTIMAAVLALHRTYVCHGEREVNFITDSTNIDLREDGADHVDENETEEMCPICLEPMYSVTEILVCGHEFDRK
jgi:hypothetical protein